MKHLSSLILLLLLPALAAGADRRSVTLITVGPGSEIYEKFGHNLIWVHDPDAGTNPCYNWGLFSFDDPNFLLNFVRGRMTYAMGAAPIIDSVVGYEMEGRLATFQRLPMTSAQIDELIRRCEANLRPENSQYRYDYFTDNCSTRVRDMLDSVTGGQVRAALAAYRPRQPSTYRRNAMRLMQDEFWTTLGMDFALGPAADRALSGWEEAFLPMRLAEGLTPVATRTWVPWRVEREPEPTTTPDYAWLLALIGFVGAAAIAACGFSGRKDLRGLGHGLAAAWWLVAGLGGAFLAGLWMWTDHAAAHANQNLLHFSPLSLALLLLMLVQRRTAASDVTAPGTANSEERVFGFRPRRADVVTRIREFATGAVSSAMARAVPGKRVMLLRWGATAVLAVSLIGMLAKAFNLLGQENVRMILLALPLNLAAAWSAWRLTAQRPADEVAGV